MLSNVNQAKSILIAKKQNFISDNQYLPFGILLYLLNETFNYCVKNKLRFSVIDIGDDVGRRLNEALLLNILKREERKIKILDVLNQIKTTLWNYLFGKNASGIDCFMCDRRHSKTNKELKEYAIYDIDPIYNLRYTNDSIMIPYLKGILIGFLKTGGFVVNIRHEINIEKDNKTRIEFIISFHEDISE